MQHAATWLNRASKKGTLLATTRRATRPGTLINADREGVADLNYRQLTPDRALAILRTAAQGDPAEQANLFDTMLEFDSHLRGVYGTRRLAITGLPFELCPSHDHNKLLKDEALSTKIHEAAQDMLAGINGFEDGLAHLVESIGRSIAVAEVEWSGGKPVALKEVAFCLLQGDSMSAARVRIRTDDNHIGLAMNEYPPGKFLTSVFEPIGGVPWRGGLLRTAVLGFMMKRYGLKWWALALELYGMPLVIAKHAPEASAQVKQEMLKMISEVGAGRGGVFPVGSEADLLETAKQSDKYPHERLVAYYDAQCSINFLGQTLTTQIGETGGANAAAQTHDEVREDIRDNDIRREGRMVREGLIIPWVRNTFGEEAVAYAPYFRRVVEEPVDLLAMASLTDIAINKLGAKIKASFVKDELGLPVVEEKDGGLEGDAALPGVRQAATELGVKVPYALADEKDRGEKKPSINSARLARATPVGRHAAWVIAAVTAMGLHASAVMGQIATFIEKRRDLETALAELPDVFAALPVADFVEVERGFFLVAKLVGINDTRGRTADTAVAHNSARVHGASADAPYGTIINADGVDFGFANIPFERAIEMLRDRVGITPEEFEALDVEARSRAWRVAGVTNMDLLASVHKQLVESIAAGETSRDFRKRVKEAMAAEEGWAGENPWHAEIVHRQNFAMAHGAGRYAEYRELGVTHWRFVAAGETCPICEPFNGKLFEMSDRKAFPPLHFNCDCEDEPVFEGEFTPDEVAASIDVKSPGLDEERSRETGFKWDPAEYANLEPLKLSGFPETLKPAFAAFAESQGWEVVK